MKYQFIDGEKYSRELDEMDDQTTRFTILKIIAKTCLFAVRISKDY